MAPFDVVIILNLFLQSVLGILPLNRFHKNVPNIFVFDNHPAVV